MPRYVVSRRSEASELARKHGGIRIWFVMRHGPSLTGLSLTIAFCCLLVSPAEAREIHVYAGRNKEAIRLTNEGSALVQAGKTDSAIFTLNKAIEVDSQMWPAYLARAKAFVVQKKQQRALRDLEQAARLKPDFFQIYLIRGIANIGLHKYHRALADLNEAARLEPNDAGVHAARAIVHVFLNDPAGALADANLALRRRNAIKNPARILNLRAWILATSKDPALRNGRQALADAKRASKMVGDKDVGALDTVAAAYAETGDFASAVRVQKQALSIATSSKEKTQLETHLAAFERREPIREDFSKLASPDLTQELDRE